MIGLEKAIVATYFHTPTHGQLAYQEQALITINQDGVIDRIVPADDGDYLPLIQLFEERGT